MGQRGIKKPPNRHCSSGGKYKDRERGLPSTESQPAAPIQSPFLPLCVATLLLGDQLLRLHGPHCLPPLPWSFPFLLAGVAVWRSAQEVASGVRQSQPPTHPLGSSGPTIKPSEP